MSEPKTIQDVAKMMRHIDIAMLSTHAPNDVIATRPMSNNRDVGYDGKSYFFTSEKQGLVGDIARNPAVGLVFEATSGLLRTHGTYIAVQGKASLIRDKEQFAAHWTKDLGKWFEQGIDTPDLVLVEVKAERIDYWDGWERGEITLH